MMRLFSSHGVRSCHIRAMRLLRYLMLVSASMLSIGAYTAAAQNIGLPFFYLLQSLPSPAANAMGGAGVAVLSTDPDKAFFNPALIGFGERGLALSAYAIPLRDEVDFFTEYEALAASLSYDVSALIGAPVSIGLGYSNRTADLGEFIRVLEEGNTPVERVNRRQSSSAWTLGVGVDYIVKAGIGITLQSISDCTTVLEVFEPKASTAIFPTDVDLTAIDYGIFVSLPVIDVLESTLNKKLTIGEKLTPNANISLGYSVTNIGDEVDYGFEGGPTLPMPRMSKLGYSVDAHLDYVYKKIPFRLMSLVWTREVNDLLVARNNGEDFTHQTPLSDVQFFNELILGKERLPNQLRSGWRIGMLEAFELSGGQYSIAEVDGIELRSAHGFAVRLKGLLKATESFIASTALQFIRKHFDARFLVSRYGGRSPAFDVEYTTLLLTVENIML